MNDDVLNDEVFKFPEPPTTKAVLMTQGAYDALQAEIATLRARVAELEAQLGIVRCDADGLTVDERKEE